MVICLLPAAGVSRAVLPRDASLMTANDPMGGGWDEKVKHTNNTADGVRDIARGTAVDGTRLTEKKFCGGDSAERLVLSVNEGGKRSLSTAAPRNFPP